MPESPPPEQRRTTGRSTVRAGMLSTVRSHLHPTDDRHRVTTLELLFDLVFVFAITNVTAAIEEGLAAGGGARSLLEGLVVLALVWFGWCSYAWLGNTAKADEGLLRLAMIVAMTGMFFVAISIPEAFAGHGNAAAVLVAAFSVVRLVHISVYLVAAGDDQQMHSVLIGMLSVILVVLALLVVGAAVGGRGQLWWWTAAVAADQIGVYFVRSSRWRLPSASHFAERFGLVIIIAIGESIVDLGTASSSAELTGRTTVALLCGIAVAVCLWWLYFDVVALVAERTLRGSTGLRRAQLARDSYTYLHFPMVAGIVFTAVGLTFLVADEHVDAGRRALYGGIVLYLAAHAVFRMRNVGGINVPRAITFVALLIALPVAGQLSTSTQLLIPAIALVALVAVEVRAFRDARELVRHGSEQA